MRVQRSWECAWVWNESESCARRNESSVGSNLSAQWWPKARRGVCACRSEHVQFQTVWGIHPCPCVVMLSLHFHAVMGVRWSWTCAWVHKSDRIMCISEVQNCRWESSVGSKLSAQVAPLASTRQLWGLSMAVAPAEDTPEGRAAAMGLLDPDLQGILQRADTSAVLQSRMAIARVRSINKLSAMADTREQARNFCRATLRLDLAADLFDVACVVESWEACRTRTEARHKMEAEAALSRMPKAVNKVELRDIRDSFERAYYVLEEKAMPAASTLELHFDQVDNGEWKAMMLTQYLSRDDAEAESWGATVDSSGNIKVKRGYSDGPKPKNTEDLRARVKLVGHTYIMAMLKYPHKTTLQGLTPTVFQKYIDHLLGGFALRMRMGRWWLSRAEGHTA